MDAASFALVLSFAAGVSTLCGGFIILIPKLLHAKEFLPACLAMSGGVLLFMAFMELYSESLEYYQEDEVEDRTAAVYAAISFFSGSLVMYLLDKVVHSCSFHGQAQSSHSGGFCKCLRSRVTNTRSDYSLISPTTTSENIEVGEDKLDNFGTVGNTMNIIDEEDIVGLEIESSRIHKDPSVTLDITDDEVDVELSNKEGGKSHVTALTISSPEIAGDRIKLDNWLKEGLEDEDVLEQVGSSPSNLDGEIGQLEESLTEVTDVSDQLLKVSILTTIAIMSHNLPESALLYMGLLADPSLGAMFILNSFFEGIAVAVPLYFSTQSRTRALFCAFLCAVTKPLGALIAYGIIDVVPSGTVLGTIFGIISGAVTFISLVELLPLARTFDVEDKVVSAFLYVGMLIMCVLLLIF